MVNTLFFLCTGCWLIPGQGTKIQHAKKKKNKPQKAGAVLLFSPSVFRGSSGPHPLVQGSSGLRTYVITVTHFLWDNCVFSRLLWNLNILFIFSFFWSTLFFNWRIVALQNFVVFCQTSTWISHRYTYVHSLLNLPPVSRPTPPV